ncbi:ceramide glucosyltransferase [Malassezia vespertilionis]|uniref:Ceramide glucosyltransferase n=1 Tax=Malassezia vespertilionis TaxID=2020962 RepID=A0A2N1JBU3_9BASI|nr:ceramide glucosyltransferase [Malassezia vespertilionis]PKI84006.1 hypothetical protein MVES_002047 [Malassezia vespertilionis]WFD06817.1 ceramide glucosyltransferase [Malassezia vespertilionis]
MPPWLAFLCNLLALVALGWFIAVWALCLLGWQVAYKLFANPYPRSPLSSAQTEEPAPSVSILRPLAGLDCNLYTNLCSSFEQHYPVDLFEVILGVRSEHDQALSVARQVVAQYPHIHSHIVVGDVEAGVNPKINNLVRPYALAKHDLVWVVDSQVWLSPHALGRAVDALLAKPPVPKPQCIYRTPHGSRTGLVHHVPLGVLPANTWGSHIERAFLSTSHAKMYLAINAVGIDSCVMGKSNMYRKSDLDRVPDAFFAYNADSASDEQHMIGSRAFDGEQDADDPFVLEMTTKKEENDVVRTKSRALARFGIYLAEDNMLALSLWRKPLELGHRIAPGDVAHVAVGDIQTVMEYAKRRMRWIRVRRHMVPEATYLEPFTESLVAGLCGWFGIYSWLLHPIIGPLHGGLHCGAFFAFYLANLAAWYWIDLGVLSSLRCGAPLPDAERKYFLGAWCMRELLAFPIWAWAMLGSTVTWRGKRYRILTNARAAHVPSDVHTEYGIDD